MPEFVVLRSDTNTIEKFDTLPKAARRARTIAGTYNVVATVYREVGWAIRRAGAAWYSVK